MPDQPIEVLSGAAFPFRPKVLTMVVIHLAMSDVELFAIVALSMEL